MNDYRLRGYTLSKGRPVATLDLSYDHPSGIYIGVSAIGVLAKDDGPRPLGIQESIGFARRLKSGLTVDAGLINANYTDYALASHARGYNEVYVGLLGSGLSSHIFFSPNYLGDGIRSVYGEVNGVVRPADHWRLNWHLGVQDLRGGQPGSRWSQTDADLRFSVTREFGATQAQITVSHGGRGPRKTYERSYGRSALVVTLTQAF